MIIKNNVLILLCFTSLVPLTSCLEEESAFQARRIIQNETNHQITIDVFAKHGGDLTERIKIVPFGADTTTTTCHIVRGLLGPCDVVWARRSDSVTLIFNGDRFITYCGESFGCYINDKDILALNVYAEDQAGFVMTEKNTFTFEITEEDYAVAIPIE